EKTFREIVEEVRFSDGVLWLFGVFVLAAPSQYMRFVELISERGVEDAFKGKYAAVLTTSIHFFDHTAHNYMRSVCEDLNMIYADGLSLYLQDLTDKDRRRDLTIFAENFFEAIEKGFTTARLFTPRTVPHFVYEPSPPEKKIVTKGKKAVVLTDAYDGTSNLGKMIDRFKQSFAEEIEVIDLRDIDIKGGCLGCMRCGYDYTCVQKDGFTDFYNNRVRTADIIVFAGEVRGPYLSSKWKEFYDRAFFWNHTPSLVGRQLGYIISGPLSRTPNLIQILEASSTTRQDANHADIVTDETENSAALDALLQSFAERLVSFAENEYVRPQNFLGVGGHKIFRDDIWGRLRMIWQADHRYFKKHGKYDFPQKELKMWIANPIMMALTKIPWFRKKFYENITKFSSGRLKKIAERKD
ncbi:MAG: flavodoxin family protein, partial [Deltaproteobacteria bacterium]|nr:flavodoxin family protein [Deltaproteobacteria bacterium]